MAFILDIANYIFRASQLVDDVVVVFFVLWDVCRPDSAATPDEASFYRRALSSTAAYLELCVRGCGYEQ